MTKLIIFVLCSAVVVWYSWPSIKKPGGHGFYRFFAFETLLVLVLLNVDHWFLQPFAINQVFSWFFLALSLLLAVQGFYFLRVIGKPEGDFENTKTLVAVGVYRFIRHPLYSSLVVGCLGVFLKDLSVQGAFLAAATCVLLDATARAEELENRTKFGTEYERYMKTTKRFIPFLY